MSYYRIWEYPNSNTPFKHSFLKRDRLEKGREDASRNSADILQFLEAKEKEKTDERFNQSLSRSRKNILDILLCNEFDYFCTFTFDGQKIDRYNFNECKKQLSKFFMNFKNRYASDFKYLVIPEFHKDGAVHFHGVCSGFPDGELTVPDIVYKRVGEHLVELPNVFNYHEWKRYHKKFGFFNCSPIRNYTACAFYISKYVTKDLITLEKGSCIYMCSHGLNRPKLVFDEEDVPMLFTPEFENEFVAVGYDRVAEQQDWWVHQALQRPWEIQQMSDEEWFSYMFYDSSDQMRIDDFWKVRFTPYEID